MTEDKIELIKYRLSKSEDTYNDALYLAEGKKWNAATNRLYYSVYYTVHALLLCKIYHRELIKEQESFFTSFFFQLI
ncbi:MAG: HEPN domain-containing protein [Bacteroidetes bacterium]|nr:MAG: HEPN domain-containing protein [Bacteroidota bacterium]